MAETKGSYQGTIIALEARVKELEAQVASRQALIDKLQEDGDDALSMESGISHDSRRPFVQLHWGKQHGKLTTEQARQHALSVLECAFAAEFDSTFVSALTASGMEHDMAARALLMMRRERGGDEDASLKR